MKDKLISMITFCKRIGKLTIGFDVAKAAMQQGNAFLILAANDLSAKTQKEVRYLTGEMDVPLRKVSITLDEFWYLIGKRAGVIAVCDEGFADKLLALIDSMPDTEEI